MKRLYKFVSKIVPSAIAITILSGCVGYGGIGGPHVRQYPGEGVEIPPGHMPPPGECRIWYPNRPPGQQPPPGNCLSLERRVPLGAFLVHG